MSIIDVARSKGIYPTHYSQLLTEENMDLFNKLSSELVVPWADGKLFESNVLKIYKVLDKERLIDPNLEDIITAIDAINYSSVLAFCKVREISRYTLLEIYTSRGQFMAFEIEKVLYKYRLGYFFEDKYYYPFVRFKHRGEILW